MKEASGCVRVDYNDTTPRPDQIEPVIHLIIFFCFV
jgi:hypothetical protein